MKYGENNNEIIIIMKWKWKWKWKICHNNNEWWIRNEEIMVMKCNNNE
jgi:hypothetical protein